MPQQFYNEEEAEEILRLATRQQFNGGVTREALLRMALEVGLTEDEVAAAETQFRRSSDEQELEKRFEKRQRANFVAEALSYVGFSAFMVAVWWMSGHGYFWPGWAIAVSLCGTFDTIPKHFMPASSAYQKAFAKWKLKGAPAVDAEEEESANEDDERNGVTIGIVARGGRRRRRRSE